MGSGILPHSLQVKPNCSGDAAPRLPAAGGGAGHPGQRAAFACDCLRSTVHIPVRSVRQASHAVFGQRTTPGLGQWRSLRRP